MSDTNMNTEPSVGTIKPNHHLPIDGREPEIGIALRLRSPPAPFFERRFVTRRVSPGQSKTEHEYFWNLVLTLIRDRIPYYVKDAPKLWDKLGLNISKGFSADIVHGREIDDDTHRAIQSALLLTYNSSTNRGDLEAAAFALACFINCHPAFNSMSFAQEFDEMFGSSTSYELMDISEMVMDVFGKVDNDE